MKQTIFTLWAWLIATGALGDHAQMPTEHSSALLLPLVAQQVGFKLSDELQKQYDKAMKDNIPLKTNYSKLLERFYAKDDKEGRKTWTETNPRNKEQKFQRSLDLLRIIYFPQEGERGVLRIYYADYSQHCSTYKQIDPDTGRPDYTRYFIGKADLYELDENGVFQYSKSVYDDNVIPFNEPRFEKGITLNETGPEAEIREII